MAKNNTKKTEKTSKKQSEESSIIVPSRKLSVTIPAATTTPAYSKAVKKLSKNLKLDGFRAGKIPVETAEKHLSHETIVETALRDLLPGLYQEAVEKEKAQPLTNPEINPVSISKGTDWVIEFLIAEKPELSIDGYEKLVTKTAKEAQKDLEKRQKQAGKEKNKEKNNEAENLSDEQKQNFILQSIYRALLEKFQPKLPELVLKEEINHEVNQLGAQLRQLKMSFEDYLKGRNMTEEQFSQLITSEAAGRLQIIFLNNAITQAANIRVEQADVDAYIKESNATEYAESQKDNPQYMRAVAQTVLNKKIADHLLSL